MRNNWFRMMVFGLFVFAGWSASEGYAAPSRGIVPVPVKDKGGKQVLLYRESHALIIGASAYTEGFQPLPGVKKDVAEVRNALEANGFHVVVVMDTKREQMQKAFDDFIQEYGQDSDDRVLVYYAGHGHTLTFKDGREMGYIVPVDAPNPNRDERGFRAKAMDMQQIEVYAKRIQSKHALFLFDSCFSGSIFAMSREAPENINYKTSKSVRQFITAGGANETVPDRSIFRDQFIAGLQGEADTDKDGYVTGMELGEFLQNKVVNYSKGTQHPEYGKIRDSSLDKGDFVFALRTGITPADAEQEKRKIVEERTQLEEKRKNLEAEKQLAEERRKLEEERERVAKLERQKSEEKAKPGNMVRIVGEEFTAGLDPDIGMAECLRHFKPIGEEKECKKKWFAGEKPHRVSVRTFSMDKYEVTQKEYEKVMGNNPSVFKGSNLPVEKVTWYEAKDYCKKVGKRLPTEWEWEKAAKGGRNSIYPWGDEFESGKANICDVTCEYEFFGIKLKSDQSNQFDDGYKTTSPVGSYPPNGYGSYDMAGNVWEWTSSDWDKEGMYKVLRGGSWDGNPYNTRSANRYNNGPGLRHGNLGFRCAQ